MLRSLLRDLHLTTLSILQNWWNLFYLLKDWICSSPFSCFEMKMLIWVPVCSSFRLLFYCCDRRRWDNWLWSSFLLIEKCFLLSAKYFKDLYLCFLEIFLNPKLSYGSLALLAFIIYLISFWLTSSSFEVYEVLLWVKISKDLERLFFLLLNRPDWVSLIDSLFFSFTLTACYWILFDDRI